MLRKVHVETGGETDAHPGMVEHLKAIPGRHAYLIAFHIGQVHLVIVKHDIALDIVDQRAIEPP